MRRRRRCLSCGGRYFAVQSSGALYFHACAPVRDQATGADEERANKRDENITVDVRGRERGIKREGDGAEDV